jgi:hypothetical protein
MHLKIKDSFIRIRISLEDKVILQQIAFENEITLSTLLNSEIKKLLKKERSRVI